MTVGAQRQAHASSRIAEPVGQDQQQARVEAVLTEPSCKTTTRLDLSTEWADVTSPISDLASLTNIAGLVRDDLLRQQLKSDRVEGYVTLHLLDSQVKHFVWIIDQLAHLGRQADEACAAFEEFLADQHPGVRARREREERS